MVWTQPRSTRKRYRFVFQRGLSSTTYYSKGVLDGLSDSQYSLDPIASSSNRARKAFDELPFVPVPVPRPPSISISVTNDEKKGLQAI